MKDYIYILIFSSLVSCSKDKEALINIPDDPKDTMDVIIPDTPIVVFFIGDSEPRMRDNTNEEVSTYVANLISYKFDSTRFFDYDSNKYRISPDIVLLGGDISADRSTSVANDMKIWQPLYDNGILFLAGFGNHDWEPYKFGDGSYGYSVAGHQSNENTKNFCKATYQKSKQLGQNFSYTELKPSSDFGPITFFADYKGVKIVNFNTFLYHPSYQYPAGWPLSCNLTTGGAGCQIYVSAEKQIKSMEDLILEDTSSTFIYFQHYPVSSSSWWEDFGASNTTYIQKRDRLFSMLSSSSKSILLTAHQHYYSHTTHTYNDKSIQEYVAPYFGGANGVDYTQGGGFIALLVSKKYGILETKRL